MAAVKLTQVIDGNVSMEEITAYLALKGWVLDAGQYRSPRGCQHVIIPCHGEQAALNVLSAVEKRCTNAIYLDVVALRKNADDFDFNHRHVVKTEVAMTAKYLLVVAEVRYWEDAKVNGVIDTEGSLIPFRHEELWKPIIELATGKVLDWKKGDVAEIHYKVCDQGEYFLLNERKEKIAQWNGIYVPDDFLCHGDEGFGDYIIFDIDKNGVIKDYEVPPIKIDQWERSFE
jgi:hypothetical protein